MLSKRLFAALLAGLTFVTPAIAQADGPGVELSPLVTRLLEDDLLTERQRRDAMIFHGQWDDLGELNPEEKLRLAVAKHEVFAPAENDEAAIARAAELGNVELTPANAYLLVKGGYLSGDPALATKLPGDFAVEASSPAWLVLIAQCHEDMGQYDKAVQALSPLRLKAQQDLSQFKTAQDLTAAAKAVLMLARLEGRPSADFHLANQMLAKARDEVDPLFWPAYVAEAELLMAKGNPSQAMEAVMQALQLNPKASEAWYLLGSMQSRFFNFEGAKQARNQLRAINEKHPLGKALAVKVALRQKDMPAALDVIESALKNYPTHRRLVALDAAVNAMNDDAGGMDASLDSFSKLAPNNPHAHFEVGQTLSDARQYQAAEPHLQSAIAMMPGWSAPQLALGELYMQWGKLKEAAKQLQTAATLDPFHKAITNQLKLSQEMLGYDTIETKQFVVRFLPGVDEVLARDVALHMGEMVEVFIQRFDHDPPRLTQVDLMPDDQHFAVRIIGLPEIWTIAACTGDVIAMTPPRPGPKRAYGAYNWLNVMGHEYAHVVNLSQTGNRVPHWFTEGCAVRMETTGRLWSQYTLLSDCFNNDKLFDYDELNWGFIRPTEEFHRPLAYAQSAWLIQYIEETYGWHKALAMLESYSDGVGEHETIEKVFGFKTDELMKGFLEWAGKQVGSWGMANYAVKPEQEVLIRLLSTDKLEDIEMDELEQAIKDHADHPELKKIRAQIVLKSGDEAAGLEAVKAYQQARPVDPWADRELARLALKRGESETAVSALLSLDKIEGDAPEYAVELARVYRARKDFDRALRFAERALLREPYNATYRESAATIAVQMGNLERAAFHVESLELLEPERDIHPRRLAAIYRRLGKDEAAEAAKQRSDALKFNGR